MKEVDKAAVDCEWPATWEEHRRAQILHWARNTTPEQRLAWVEAMLLYMAQSGQSYQERKRRFEKPI